MSHTLTCSQLKCSSMSTFLIRQVQKKSCIMCHQMNVRHYCQQYEVNYSPAPDGPMIPFKSELRNSPLIELRIFFFPSREDT